MLQCPDYQGVLISGVEKYTNVAIGIAKTVLYIEVSLFQSVLIEGSTVLCMKWDFSLLFYWKS